MPPPPQPKREHHEFIFGLSGIDPRGFETEPATYPGPLPATESDLYFDYDDATLTPGDERALITYADKWKNAAASIQVILVGYASMEGNEQYNAGLAGKRVQAAKAYLISLGIPKAAITESSKGATSKFSTSDLRENRRVTIAPRIARSSGQNTQDDPSGSGAPDASHQVPATDDPKYGGKPMLGPKARTASFFIRHPEIASEIGEEQHGETNISTNATRFSAGLRLKENAAHEGSEVNAMRHVLWQATIASKFGADIAREVGAAHEEDPSAADDVTDTTGKVFATLAKADETIDLLNNKLGRQIAADNKGLAMRDLAFKVLDEFHARGLWTAVPNAGGTYGVSRTQLSNDEYDYALKKLKTLNADGFDPDEAIKHDQEVARAKKEREEAQRANRGPKF